MQFQDESDSSARLLAAHGCGGVCDAWVDWFNNRRLPKPFGYIPPAELEAKYYQQLDSSKTYSAVLHPGPGASGYRRDSTLKYGRHLKKPGKQGPNISPLAYC